MEDKLLTREDVANRWQCSISTIKNYEKDGILNPCKGIPLVRFSLQHILELEGVKLDKLSPIERKRLEGSNNDLREENEKLKRILGSIMSEATKIYKKES